MSDVPIPGSGVLGWGFSIFDRFSDISKTVRLFGLGDSGKTWTYSVTGKDYALGGNVNVSTISRSTATSSVFKGRKEFEEHFAAKAKVSGGYGAFAGQFEASYGNTSKHDSEYLYGMLFSEHSAWRLDLQSQNRADLAKQVLEDPDFTDLPEHNTPKDQIRFFRFFDKFGTHFVSAVTTGSRLYYSMAVEKSFNSNERQVDAKLKAEYKAAFEAGAEASTQWKQVGKKWTENRVVSVEVVGGDSSPLEMALPAYGDNFQAGYKAWLKSAEGSPAPIGFELKPIANLFPGEQREAVNKAFLAYAQDRIYAEAKFASSMIMLRGKVMTPEPPLPELSSGIQVCVIDRKTLEAKDNTVFAVPWEKSYKAWIDAYKRLYEHLQKFDDPANLVVLATHGLLATWAPPEANYQQLLGLGADPGKLRNWIESIGNNGASTYPHPVNYLLIGIPRQGPSTGFDALTHGNGSVYFDANKEMKQSRVVAPTPAAILTVSLRHLRTEDFKNMATMVAA